ncbi:MAG TPA: substrate-binding domain-containing protein [Polyangia bacterium]|nr:substrate-binding domain-containing protein [Polyangia bacterium]
MRRLFLLAIVAVGAPLGLGCAKSPDAGKPRVGFLLSTLQEERYQKDKQYFETAARKLGLAPFTLSADNDNARQLNEVEDALARGAKVLVIQPTDSAAAGAYVSKAHEHGVPVIAYDRDIKSGAVDYYVAHDSFRVGVLQAEAAVKATGGQGNYVLLDGQSGHSVAMEIARGYYSVLQPYIDAGKIHVVVEKSHDAWSPEQALKTVEDAITKTQRHIDAILANNSGMARGAVQAVQAAKLAHVFIAGADADAANVEYVCEGKQSVEVLKAIKPLAERAAEVASQLVRTGMAEGAAAGKTPVAAVAVSLVDPTNARALVIDSGFQSATALPACK